MKPSDLVSLWSGAACYDAPIDHHNAGDAIRHYVGMLDSGSVGVVLEVTTIAYADGTKSVGWCQILTGGRSAWVLGTNLRFISSSDCRR